MLVEDRASEIIPAQARSGITQGQGQRAGFLGIEIPPGHCHGKCGDLRITPFPSGDALGDRVPLPGIEALAVTFLADQCRRVRRGHDAAAMAATSSSKRLLAPMRKCAAVTQHVPNFCVACCR